jgi:hypothetical protein
MRTDSGVKIEEWVSRNSNDQRRVKHRVNAGFSSLAELRSQTTTPVKPSRAHGLVRIVDLIRVSEYVHKNDSVEQTKSIYDFNVARKRP